MHPGLKYAAVPKLNVEQRQESSRSQRGHAEAAALFKGKNHQVPAGSLLPQPEASMWEERGSSKHASVLTHHWKISAFPVKVC